MKIKRKTIKHPLGGNSKSKSKTMKSKTRTRTKPKLTKTKSKTKLDSDIVFIQSRPEDEITRYLKTRIPSMEKYGFLASLNKQHIDLKTIVPNKHTTVCKENIALLEDWARPKDLFISLKDGSCVSTDSDEGKKEMLKTLNSFVKPHCVISPKQLMSNCWMNTLFMSTFVSDLGRYHHRWMRHAMITSLKLDGTPIEKKQMRIMMRRLNMSIQAALDCNADYVGLLNTNDIINYIVQKFENLHKSIANFYIIESTVYEPGKAGNPNKYLNWLKAYLAGLINDKSTITLRKVAFFPLVLDILSLSPTDFDEERHISKLHLSKDTLKASHFNEKKWYHIILKSAKETRTSKTALPKYLHVHIDGKEPIIFKLDSVNMIDTESKHFTSFITIKNDYYAFDGASFSRLSHFDWTKYINEDKNMSFIRERGPSTLKYNFMTCYFEANYYRIN